MLTPLFLLWFSAYAVASTLLCEHGLWRWFVIEAQKELPALFFVGLYAWITVDLLTPNPKRHGRVVGWLYWETIEHIVYPAIFVFANATLPVWNADTLIVMALLLVLYGRFLGEVRSNSDLAKLCLLAVILLNLPALPTLILALDYAYGISGIAVWLAITAILVPTYLIIKLKRKREDYGIYELTVSAGSTEH